MSGGVGVFVKKFLEKDIQILNGESSIVSWFQLNSKYIGKRVLFGAV